MSDKMLWIMVLFVVCGYVQSICQECDRSFCPSTESCNVTTLDECGCCHVCVRGLDENCGGAYGKYGVCQKGLECVLMETAPAKSDSEFVGTCKDEDGQPDCDAVACPPISFDCPWDSNYIASQHFNNSCCKIPGSCECDLTRCNDVACPPQHTRKLQSAAERVPGKCCDMYECLPETTLDGVCVDPQTGLRYDSGEYWQRDSCTPCTCFSGAPKCYSRDCPRLTCPNPVKLDDECCPTCPDGSLCGAFKCDLDCSSGYQVDDRRCPICQCHKSTSCDRLDCGSLDCPNGYKIGEDGCEMCECHQCQDTMKHCALYCGYGFEKDSRGCLLCKCKIDSKGSTIPAESKRCYENGEVHEDGAVWEPNPCSTCTCYSGKSACSIVECAHIQGCKNPITLGGKCCPICKDGCVDSMQVSRDEQETWREDCKQCRCYNGTVRCTDTDCPPLQCTDSVIIPGKCCPVCQTVVQNVVTDKEYEYVLVIIVTQDLKTLTGRQKTFLQHLGVDTDYTFSTKLLFSANLRSLRIKSNTATIGSIALVNAALSKEEHVLATNVIQHIKLDTLLTREPTVVKIMTYSDYLELAARTEGLNTRSRFSIGAIIGFAIATLIIAVLLVLYGTRRYMILSHRRKFKNSASMGQSADQLIHAVDTNRLTINLHRPRRPSVDSMLSGTSPMPSDTLSPSAYRPVMGHDNLAQSPFEHPPSQG